MGLRSMARRRLADRTHYRRSRDWWLSLYNRLLQRVRPLPFRGRVCTIHPVATEGTLSLRLGTSDWYVFDEIFVRGDYRPAVELAGEARTVVDLGANIGMSIRFWRDRFPAARIVAVEADAQNARLCRLNAGREPVELIQACAAGRSGSVYLDRSRGAWAFRMSRRPEGEPVQALTVPDLLKQAGIEGEVDLLKCDIEGAEAEVFGACRAWISRIRALVVEVHEPYTGTQLLQDLGPGFEVRHRAPGGGVEVLFLRRRGSVEVQP